MRWKIIWHWLVAWTREFFINTCQHGYKYVVRRDQHWTERLLWLIVIVLSIIFASNQIWVALNFNQSNPTLTVMESIHYNIWNLPFPAVTICSINRIHRSNALNIVKKMKLPPGKTSEDVFDTMYLLTELIVPTKENITEEMILLQNTLNLNNLSVEKVLKQVSPSCDQMIMRCMWKGRIRLSCSELFTIVKSYEGYCCSFNYQGLNNELFSKHVNHKVSEKRAAHRISTTGYKSGLSVIVYNSYSEYYASTLASYGYKVLIHNPYSFPDATGPQIIIPGGVQTFLSVRSTQTFASQDVKDIPIAKRRCRFQDEASSMTMQYYTYNNCFIECQYNYTMKLCGCIPVFYPSLGGDKKCDLTDVPCLTKYKDDITAIHPTVNGSEVPDLDEGVGLSCNCLPGCLHTTFRVDDSKSALYINKLIQNGIFLKSVDAKEHSVFHVFFGDLVTTRYHMRQFYTWLDLMASLGGLLSLLLGFSFMSAIEIIYFFTIRLFFYFLTKFNWKSQPSPHKVLFLPTNKNRH